jgi:hypothetical protein
MESDDTPVTDVDLGHAPIKMVSVWWACQPSSVAYLAAQARHSALQPDARQVSLYEQGGKVCTCVLMILDSLLFLSM